MEQYVFLQRECFLYEYTSELHGAATAPSPNAHIMGKYMFVAIYIHHAHSHKSRTCGRRAVHVQEWNCVVTVLQDDLANGPVSESTR